jgi:hypothetical protein
MTLLDLFQLFVPVITFAMGYFLTNIGYRRERKLGIIREKFEKLYHPFYMLIHEFGTDVEGGFAFDSENLSSLKPLLDHLSKNAYLASSEGQKIIWETRAVFTRCMKQGDAVDKETEDAFGASLSALFEHLVTEYVKSSNALGYEQGEEYRTLSEENYEKP